MASIRLVTGSPVLIDTDLLVVPVFDAEPIAEAIPAVDAATGGEARRAAAAGEFKGRPGEFFVTPARQGGWKAARIALAGAGRREDFDLERLRKVATASGLAARARHVSRVAFLLRGPLPPADGVQVIVEGLILASFSVDRYKTGERFGAPADEVIVAADSGGASQASLDAAVKRGIVLGESSNAARELANEPSNLLTPRVFAERAAAIAKGAGVKVEILEEKAIERLGMGLLLGVARGSAEPPRVIVLRHEPKRAPKSPVLGLIGKGITFDTGGISIKPADGMERMKDDMAGGAAVACAMRAVGLLRAPIRVIGVVPATENMPGGRAIKPGDILKSAEGQTVEVINTDAEGRLVLA